MLAAPQIHGAYRGGPSFEPGAHFAASFRRGRYRRGAGRGRLLSTPTEIPGFTSAGGAGFGWVKRNGVWVNVAANQPLIGDDGLEGWQQGQNLNPQSGELTGANGWATSGGTPLNGVTGAFVQGLRATRFTFPTSSLFGFRLYNEQSGDWFAPIGGIAGMNLYAPGRVSFSFVAPAGCTSVRVYPVRGVGQETFFRYKAFPVTPGQTYTVRWVAAKDGHDYSIAAFEFRAGLEMGDPPVQTDALAATRTGTSYIVSGLEIQPTHYGVCRFYWGAPYGAGAVNFPSPFQGRTADSTNSWILWRRSNGGPEALFFVRINDVNVFGFSTPAAQGTWETLAWRCKAGDHAASLNGGPLHKTAAPAALPSPIPAVGLINSDGGSNNANGVMSDFVVWNGDVSDADLRAICARYAGV